METSKTITFNFGIRDILIIVLGGLLLFNMCGRKKAEDKHEKGNYDSLYSKMKSDSLAVVSLTKILSDQEVKLVASESKSDSLMKAKVKADKRYAASSGVVRDEIKEGICDTNSVKQALNDCDSVRLADDFAISQKDSTISVLKEQKETLKSTVESQKGIIDAAKIVLKGQAEDNAALEGEINTIKRTNRITATLAIIGGVLKDAVLIILLKK